MEVNLLILILFLIAILWLGYLLGKAAARLRDETAIRADAVRRSRATLSGQFSEQLAPYLPGFSWRPTEARFLGKPIDLLVFKGLDERRVDEVVFVEVKTGAAKLSPVERSLRDAIKAGKVSWAEYRPPQPPEGLSAAPRDRAPR